jgi:hypothetical protein
MSGGPPLPSGSISTMGGRQEEAGDVCVCIILTASKKGIIKTQQYSHCLVQISDGITRWQRETEREREDTSACD